ncbi:carboxylesterase/lipase family protein [Pedobacter mucosus]|uniref:carboxylesterase/lipase family protein n=1 Tax=Pedobacter mucosus TaxID=2895286 RepID=UPI001EE459D5|nr:carboxylesterase family protein [Pedobacter mucosus]UKT62964.1 carboxylesterase family protein [Pedobacter mucosus]
MKKLLLAFLFSSLCIFNSWAQSAHTLKISNGYLRGQKEGNVLVFKGVPYAEPPVGKLRFKAPEKKLAWIDTLNCTSFTNPAAQFNGKTGVVGNEDCLSLNIYTPQITGKSKLPVLVWVHGGSLTAGSGSGQNGHAFADTDSVVTITINYRLGVFGFLYMGDVDDNYKTSGNNGLQDLIMSLSWIKENVASFGGDPNRVTVMGESAGAKLASTLLLNPKARNLYDQLILESGGVQCVRDSTTAKAIRARILKVLNLKSPKDLLNCSTEQLITAQNKVCNGAQGTNYFGPVLDGQIITNDAYEYIKNNPDTKKRFLIGTNKVESKLFINMDKRLNKPKKKVLFDWFGNNSHLVLKQFKKAKKTIGQDSAAKMVLTQYMYTMHSYRLADLLSQTNNNVWMYRFDYSKDGKGASHADELAYVWYLPNQKSLNINSNLAVEIHQNWVNFIRGKGPQKEWSNLKSYKPIMVFDQVSKFEYPATIFNDLKYPTAGFILN